MSQKRILADWCASRGEGYQCEDTCLYHKHSYMLNSSADTKCHLLLVRTGFLVFSLGRHLVIRTRTFMDTLRKKINVFFLLSGEKIQHGKLPVLL